MQGPGRQWAHFGGRPGCGLSHLGGCADYQGGSAQGRNGFLLARFGCPGM